MADLHPDSLEDVAGVTTEGPLSGYKYDPENGAFINMSSGLSAKIRDRERLNKLEDQMKSLEDRDLILSDKMDQILELLHKR